MNSDYNNKVDNKNLREKVLNPKEIKEMAKAASKVAKEAKEKDKKAIKAAKEALKNPYINLENDAEWDLVEKEFFFIPLKKERVEVPKRENQLQLVEIPDDRHVPDSRAKPKGFGEAYLNNFVTAITNVIGTTSDVLFDHDIGPVIVDQAGPVQLHVKELGNYIQKAAHHFLNLGFAVNKNVEKAIQEQNLQEIVSPNLKMILSWLNSDKAKLGVHSPMDGLRREAVFANLLKQPLRPDLQKYLEPVLQWIFSEHSLSLSKFLKDEVENFDVTLAKETLIALSKLMIESKVAYLGQSLTKVLQEQLPAIVKRHLREDVLKVIGRIELEKVAELIQELDWTKFIDTTVGTVRDLVGASKASIDAEQGYKNQSKDKMRRAGVSDELVRDGSNEAAETTLLHTYSNYRNDKKQNIVHEVTAAILEARNRGYSSEDARIEAERKFYSKKIDQILGIFFPSTSADLKFWKDQFGIPVELNHLYEEAKSLAQEIISPELVALFKQLPQPWLELTKEFFESMVLDRLKFLAKEQIIIELTKKIDKFTHPDKIDALMATSILPKVIPVLIETLTKQALKVNYLHGTHDEPKMVTRALHDYITEATPDIKQTFKNQLKDLLYRWTQRLQKENNITSLEITAQEYGKSIDGFIDDLVDKINSDQGSNTFSINNVMNVLNTLFIQESGVYDVEQFFEEILRNNYKDYTKDFHSAVNGDKNAVDHLQEKFRKEMLSGKFLENSSLKEEYKAQKKDFADKDNLNSAISKYISKNMRKIQELEDKNKAKGPLTIQGVNYYYESKFQNEAEANETLDVYVSLINNIVEMSTLSGPIKTLMSWDFVKRKIKEELAKNIKFLRTSPEFILSQVAEQVPKAMTVEVLNDLIFGPETRPKPELRHEMNMLEGNLRKKESEITGLKKNLKEGSLTSQAKEDLKRNLVQAENEKKEIVTNLSDHELYRQHNTLRKNFVVVAGLIQNLALSTLDYESNYAASFWARKGAGVAYGVVAKIMGSPDELADMISDMYNKMFHYQWKTKNNAFQLMDIALNTFEAQNNKLLEKKKDDLARALV